MKNFITGLLLAVIPLLAISQTTPTSVNRGAANLTQVDQYLTAAKRLGIPTSPTDNLAATSTPQNSAKILYNTTLNKLRVYNPVSETWRDAIEADLTDYYTKGEIDTLLGGKQNTLVSGTNIKTLNGETLLGSGNIDIEGALYTATNGIAISGSNVISPVYGTTAGTIAQGNDSRINNGQTAFGWGNHAGLYLPLTGGTVTGVIKSPAPVADADLANKEYVDSKNAFELIDTPEELYQDKAIAVIPFGNKDKGYLYKEGAIDFSIFTYEDEDSTTIGSYSFQTGVDNISGGDFSNIIGGRYNTINPMADFSNIIGGSSNHTVGYGSLIIGGEYSSILEDGWVGNIMIGGRQNNINEGPDNIIIGGSSNNANGSGFILGSRISTVDNGGGIINAYNAYASGTWATVIGGVSNTANEFGSLVIGRNSTDGAAQSSWIDGSPIFKVGNGTSTSDRRNAYTLYNDGRSEQIKDVEVTEIGQGVVIKSPDGTRWRITVDNNGDLTTTSL